MRVTLAFNGLSSTEADLIKRVAYKKACICLFGRSLIKFVYVALMLPQQGFFDARDEWN